ncbi:pentatricopeptide repeat-containing protein At4g19191, mitochondrial-like [Aristolochia californica]|uniref:pentatricopeptide repeat-containing protein At4g19191, mitochondrial-like n=1 Tax=Aristolochia californica TaxID=171875 RepID=UPI0035D6A5C6
MQHTQLPKHLFKSLPARRSLPFNCNSLSSLLDLCTKIQHLQQNHARFVLHGLHQNSILSSKLIECYANLGHVSFSERVFGSVTNPDALLYNTIVRALSGCGDPEKTLLMYHQMLAKSFCPDEFTYPFVFKSCSDFMNVEEGKRVHCHVVKMGFESNVMVGTAVAEMYVSCCEMESALRAAEGMFERSLAVWNLLISGYRHSGHPVKSFWMLKRMRVEGLEPNSVTVVSLLRSSIELKWLGAGRFLHVLIIMCDLQRDMSVITALLTMYSKLDCLDMARLVFKRIQEKDSVIWNLMVSTYCQGGYPKKALQLVTEMGKSGVRSDLFTAIASISSAAALKSLELGKQIHAQTVRNGSDYQVSIHNSLIDMYGKCGNLEMAKTIFESLMNRTVVSWSSMIKAYAIHDRCSDALSLYEKMKMEGVKLDQITVVNILPACVHLGALEKVKSLHVYSVKHGLILITSVLTALLVSYAKCGCIGTAEKLFDEEEVDKDIVSWNSMISAFAKHGDWFRSFGLYNQMKDLKVRPDKITFLGLLTACVNSGLVKEGWECFNEMIKIHGYRPNQEHYACMVDLLGRMGQLKDAIKLIETMPFEPDVQVWGPLLSACNMHSDTRLAEFAAKRVIALEPKNAGNYVILSNIYAAAGKWDGVARMRAHIRDRGLKKVPGCSWLEISGCTHEFRVADRSHPRSQEIYAMLNNLEEESKLIDDLSFEVAFFMVESTTQLQDLCTENSF